MLAAEAFRCYDLGVNDPASDKFLGDFYAQLHSVFQPCSTTSGATKRTNSGPAAAPMKCSETVTARCTHPV